MIPAIAELDSPPHGEVRKETTFSCAVDHVTEPEWSHILKQFKDANLYQTWPYEEVQSGRSNMSHLVLKSDGEVVAAAQVRVVKVPLIGAGIAYVRWGPLWRRHNRAEDPEIFRHTIRALQNEYAVRRGLLLRIFPVAFRNHDSSSIASILSKEGFNLPAEGARTERTLLLDLTKPLEELKQGLRQHWRRNLRIAEKSSLEVDESSDEQSFNSFIQIYKEMVHRKEFIEPNKIDLFRLIQKRLPQQFKMKVLLCKSAGEVCAGLICSAMGNTGIYLFGATSNSGLKLRGSYLLHWRMIEYLKQQGFSIYDLNGINPATNPGTYRFKSDLCGENGQDVFFLGRFDSCTSRLSRSFVTAGERLKSACRHIQERVQSHTV